MPVENVSCSINNNYKLNHQKVKKNTFESFVPQNSLYPQIPLNVSKSYAIPQLYPEYKVLETFKLPNTGEGKVYQLRNGHKVIVLPKKGTTAIYTYVGAGWNNEPPNKREIAHLLEHLLAARKYKKNNNELEKIYDTLALLNNAGTADSYTKYFSNSSIFDVNELEKLIKYQSEILLKPEFDDNQILQEQKTITEELLQKNLFPQNNYDLVKEQKIKNLFGVSNPLAQFAISKNCDAYEVNKLTKNDLLDFYNKYYRPDNMFTTIVGNVDDNTIKTFCKYFGNQESKQSDELKQITEKAFATPIQNSIRTDIESIEHKKEKANAVISILRTDLLSPQEKAYCWMIDHIIEKRLEDKKLYSAISYDDLIYSYKKHSWDFSIFATEDNVNDKINSFYQEINSIIQNGFLLQDILYAQNLYKKYNIFDEEMNALQLSDVLSNNLMFTNDPAKNKVKNYIYSATPISLYNSFIKNYDFNKASVVVVHPTKKQNNISFKGNVKLNEIIRPEEYTLPNNIHVLFDESDDILKTTVKYSLFIEPNVKINPNILSFISEKLSNNKIKDLSYDNRFDYDATLTNQKLDLYFNGKNTNTLDFIDMGINEILYPNFGTKEDFDYWKSKEAKNVKFLDNATEKQTKEIFKDAPWVLNKIQTSNLTINDVSNFHKNLLTNSQLSVLITIPKSASKLYKHTIFNKLAMLPVFKPYNYSSQFNSIPVTPLKENKIYIEKNDDKIVKIMKSYKMIKSGNIKDLVAINVLNYILGKDSNGLLFKLLRNEKNIAYGAYSDLYNNTALQNISRLNLSTTTSAKDYNNLKTAIEEFNNCIQKLQTELVDIETLEKAKRRFKNTIYMDCDSSYGRNNILDFCNNSFYGKDFLVELEKAIDNITPYDIKEIAKYYLSQPALYSISGNKESIEANKDYLKTLGEIVE